MIIKCLEDAKNLIDEQYGNKLIYRGQTNTEWELTPKIFREKSTITNSAKYELACFRPYLNQQNIYFKSENSPLEHLINLQHYEGSARLLDFSNNLLVSLFFACYDPLNLNKNKNGKLFVLHRDFFDTYYSRPCNMYYIDSVKNEIKRLMDADRFYLVESSIKNPRMKQQDGLFLMFPLRILAGYEINKPVNFNDFMKEENIFSSSKGVDSKFWIAHMEIAANSKSRILKELDDEFGINSDSIYQNNLTNTQITNNFSDMLADINSFYEKLLLTRYCQKRGEVQN